jgi:two-component system, NarL family, nitrate/nitrite response regulator NarL
VVDRMVERPILIVEDDRSLRITCASLLADAGFTVEVAAVGEEALERLNASTPRLVILDIHMPGISGYDILRRLRDHHGHGLPVLIISGVRTEPFDRAAALMAGADDFLVKPFAVEELMARVQSLLRRTAPPSSSGADRLTDRELQILTMLAEGSAQTDIAEDLSISPRTVATHIERILSKLGVHSRAQAVALAYQESLVPVEVIDR